MYAILEGGGAGREGGVAVLGMKTKHVCHTGGRRGGEGGGGRSPGDENKACMPYWGEEGCGGRVFPKSSAANQILSKTQNSCSSQSWGMKTKPVHNTGGGGGRGVVNQQQIRFSFFSSSFVKDLNSHSDPDCQDHTKHFA